MKTIIEGFPFEKESRIFKEFEKLKIHLWIRSKTNDFYTIAKSYPETNHVSHKEMEKELTSIKCKKTYECEPNDKLILFELYLKRWYLHEFKVQTLWDEIDYRIQKNLDLWANYLNMHQIELVIFESYPHTHWAYELLIAAKIKRIKYITFVRTTEPVGTFLSDNVSEPYQKTNFYEGKSRSINGEQTADKPTYFQIRKDLKTRLYGKFIKRDLDFWNSKCFQNNIICYFLHMDPEDSTLPISGRHANQLINLYYLRKIYDEKNWEIIVKEHPNQHYSLSRSRNYYKVIKELKIKLTEKETPELIEMSTFTATVCGHVGIETMMRNKWVLTFGAAWYDGIIGNKKFEIDMDKEFWKEKISREEVAKEINEKLQYTIPGSVAQAHKFDFEVKDFCNGLNTKIF